MEVDNKDIVKIAKILKAMSHPIRLKILCLLQDKELAVNRLHDELQTSNANISQHLSILRNNGIIDYRRDANFIYNRISDKNVMELIGHMRHLFCRADK